MLQPFCRGDLSLFLSVVFLCPWLSYVRIKWSEPELWEFASATWIRLDRLDKHDTNQYSCSHVVSVTQVQIFEEEWDTYFLGVNIRICPVVPSTARGFPMQPVATAKAQENGQCHNHGLAHNAQTMGEYSGCHRTSWFVKPTGWYSHLGALWIVARSWTMRKTIKPI